MYDALQGQMANFRLKLVIVESSDEIQLPQLLQFSLFSFTTMNCSIAQPNACVISNIYFVFQAQLIRIEQFSMIVWVFHWL